MILCFLLYQQERLEKRGRKVLQVVQEELGHQEKKVTAKEDVLKVIPDFYCEVMMMGILFPFAG